MTGVTIAAPGINSLPGQIRPSTGWFLGYATTSSSIDLTATDVLTPGSVPFGTATSVTASSFSGDPFGLDAAGRFGVPAAYTSGSPISGSLIFSNQDFVDLGLTAGSGPYTWTLPSSDTISLSVVPEPSTYALLSVLAMAGLALLRHRMRR